MYTFFLGTFLIYGLNNFRGKQTFTKKGTCNKTIKLSPCFRSCFCKISLNMSFVFFIRNIKKNDVHGVSCDFSTTHKNSNHS